MTIPRILAIAGSDSGGGAGIQADIKTITALGGHAMTAITAITAQNSVAVTRVLALPAELVVAQIDAVARDIGIDAVKIGMIGSVEVAEALVAIAADLPHIVFDPVMIATSGAMLADAGIVAAFGWLMDRAALITPNSEELAVLTNMPVGTADQMESAARSLADRHGRAVLAKGGHLAGEVLVDLLVRPGGSTRRWTSPRINTRHTHGTGCTLSSGIAAGLGAGMTLEDAIDRSRGFLRAALLAAPGLGQGSGPMGHGVAARAVSPLS